MKQRSWMLISVALAACGSSGRNQGQPDSAGARDAPDRDAATRDTAPADAPTIPRVGLVGEWLFDGTAADTSGNVDDGIVHGATYAADRAGNPNSALSLDGSTQWVEVPDASALDLMNDLTISAWVDATSLSALAGIVSKYRVAGSEGYVLRLAYDPPYDELDFDEASSHILVDGSAVLATNAWHHVAATTAAGTVSVYIDAQLAYTGTAGYALPTNHDPLAIGLDYTVADGRFFAGAIDDVRIYDRALSTSEIAELATP